ncbi:hypothetical protein [Streptacidiphilus cavernicola]|uniref:Uncharacterized protein n=1 Tax=Streptacidiphilus cavernicola TaxID=3342716 RepID=A0ABV6VXX8_9ACTN
MSRYNARVRADAGLTGTFACDSLHVDSGGNLSLNLQRSTDEVVTIARFQHGYWSSYELDVDPNPEPDSFTDRGNQLRAKEAAEIAALTAEWQSARTRADCSSVVAALDLHRPCHPYSIVQCAHCQTGSDAPDKDFARWPCATYTALTNMPVQAAEPERRPLAPMDITLTMQGTVGSEQDIAEAIRRALFRQSKL